MHLYKAVIDTYIIFAGLYSSFGSSHKILRLIEEGRIKPYLSTSLLFEYEEILKRNKKQLNLNNRDIEKILNSLCKMSEHRKIHFLWRPQLRDPKDDHILELAVASNNADIITFIARDFLPAQKFNVRIVTPKKVLEDLL